MPLISQAAKVLLIVGQWFLPTMQYFPGNDSPCIQSLCSTIFGYALVLDFQILGLEEPQQESRYLRKWGCKTQVLDNSCYEILDCDPINHL